MSASVPPLPQPLYGRRRALVRAAFAALEVSPKIEYRYAQQWSGVPPRVWKRPGGDVRLVVVVPTVTRGSLPSGMDDRLRRIAEAVSALAPNEDDVHCLVAVVLYEADGADLGKSRLEEIERIWHDFGTAVPWVGVSLSEPSKVLALNCTVPLLDTNGATAIAWFDDDVEVMPNCLTALLNSFDPGITCVYGARIIGPKARPGWLTAATRMLRDSSTNSYPYGCAMLMSRATFGDGIPLVYMSDDHFYPLWLLDPHAMDPMHRLRVVSDAVVRVGPTPSRRVALRRVVRNYRNVQRVLADTDPATARYFRRRLHFGELRPARDLREALTSRYWMQLTFQVVRALLWQVLVAEVTLRGLLGRPRPAIWSSRSVR